MAQLEYLFKTIFSEFSKFFVIGLFFLDNIPLYLFSALLVSVLRITGGGIHFRHYASCFAMSLTFFLMALRILPHIVLPLPFNLLSIAICAILCFKYGPVQSSFRVALSKKALCFSKLLSLGIILSLFFYTNISPYSIYSITGYWIIILHTLQLLAAKHRKEKAKHEQEKNF